MLEDKWLRQTIGSCIATHEANNKNRVITKTQHFLFASIVASCKKINYKVSGCKNENSAKICIQLILFIRCAAIFCPIFCLR